MNPSETYEFVSWDDEIPNIIGKSYNSMVPVTTNQYSHVKALSNYKYGSDMLKTLPHLSDIFVTKIPQDKL